MKARYLFPALAIVVLFAASFVSLQAQIRTGEAGARTSMDPDRPPAVSSSTALLADSIRNIAASFRAGQVFVTWDNLAATGIRYTLYRSATPIQHGYELAAAANLGTVRDHSGYNRRLSEIIDAAIYLKTDSSALPLESAKGLFVATTTAAGSFYYAVTATATGIEDTAIVPGANATTAPVTEAVMMPEPVWQGPAWLLGRQIDIYVQYCTRVGSALYPVMTNVGSYPLHFAVSKGSGSAPASTVVLLHPDGSHFLDPIKLGFWNPDAGECIVTIDDWLPDQTGGTTCFYGYHENYDIFSDANPVPTSGTLYDYTFSRMKYTMDWVVRHVPVDSTRMSVAGLSAGAVGALFTALMLPTRFASAVAIAPQCDMSTTVFPLDNMHWGTPQSNLPTNDGLHRNTRLSAGFLAGTNRASSMPVLFTFCGKNDMSVGWAEKIPFYDTLNRAHHGGFHFWDQTNHSWTASPWKTGFASFSFIYRYRTDRSYPAFSNCSLNGDPGNGNPTSGSNVGTINGLLDWSDQIIDTLYRWEAALMTRSLTNAYGTIAAPDSGTTDVTLRRLQKFTVPANWFVGWENTRNGVVIQHGVFRYDGVPVTIPGVKVYRDSSRLSVWATPDDGVAEQEVAPQHYVLEQNYPNPFNPATTIRYGLPVRSQVTVRVFNALGQQVTIVQEGEREAGYHEVRFDAHGLSSGVYFYRLQAGSYVETKKLLLVR